MDLKMYICAVIQSHVHLMLYCLRWDDFHLDCTQHCRLHSTARVGSAINSAKLVKSSLDVPLKAKSTLPM